MNLRFTEPTKDWRRTICIDFDGVLAEYDGWKGPEFFGEPRVGTRKFLYRLREKRFKIIVFTLRPEEKVVEWFERHELPLPELVTNVKIPALVYVDDRGLKFNGNFDFLLSELEGFSTHWEDQSKTKYNLIAG